MDSTSRKKAAAEILSNETSIAAHNCENVASAKFCVWSNLSIMSHRYLVSRSFWVAKSFSNYRECSSNESRTTVTRWLEALLSIKIPYSFRPWNPGIAATDLKTAECKDFQCMICSNGPDDPVYVIQKQTTPVWCLYCAFLTSCVHVCTRVEPYHQLLQTEIGTYLTKPRFLVG